MITTNPLRVEPVTKALTLAREALDLARQAQDDDKPWFPSCSVVAAIAAIDAALSAPQAVRAVPAGWALVPEKLTEAMHAAAVRTVVRCTGNADWPPRVYRAMLAAAPSAPQPSAAAPEPAKRGAVWINGALQCCEEHDREPCPHDPARRCAKCPGGATGESA